MSQLPTGYQNEVGVVGVDHHPVYGLLVVGFLVFLLLLLLLFLFFLFLLVSLVLLRLLVYCWRFLFDLSQIMQGVRLFDQLVRVCKHIILFEDDLCLFELFVKVLHIKDD